MCVKIAIRDWDWTWDGVEGRARERRRKGESLSFLWPLLAPTTLSLRSQGASSSHALDIDLGMKSVLASVDVCERSAGFKGGGADGGGARRRKRERAEGEASTSPFNGKNFFLYFFVAPLADHAVADQRSKGGSACYSAKI